MASEKLSGFIISNEIANFKGTPRKFADLQERLQSKFPESGQKFFAKKVPSYISWE